MLGKVILAKTVAIMSLTRHTGFVGSVDLFEYWLDFELGKKRWWHFQWCTSFQNLLTQTILMDNVVLF